MIKPTNEQGVVVLFQELSKQMGYKLVSVQTRFPDAIVQDLESGREYRAEFEYKSSNFVSHKHDPNGCDVIICWIDDMLDTPVPIISIKDYLEREKEEKRQKALRQFQVGGFISVFMWYLLGFSLLFVSDDVILKSMAGGNMIIFTVVLLGMFVFSKTNEQ